MTPPPLLSCPSTRPPPLLNPLPLERRAYSCSHVCGICARGARQPHQGRGGKRRRGNLSKVTLPEATLLGNVGWAILGKAGQLWARLCKAGQRKTTKNIPPTFHRPSSSVFRGNYECFPFRVGFIRACEKFLFSPFSQTLELDMRTSPWSALEGRRFSAPRHLSWKCFACVSTFGKV